MEMRISLVFWIWVNSWNYAMSSRDEIGIDIGYSCTHDIQCTAGNGGDNSKCNKDLNICICTINHLGEDKCLPDSHMFDRVCRPKPLYTIPEVCTLECSSIGTIIWKENEDWYGQISVPFASFILDKKTSVCYDPRRALNSVPDAFEIRKSTLPNAGSGIFTNTYLEQHTMFGPYKGTFEPDTDIASESGYSWKIEHGDGEKPGDIVWIDAKDISLSNWMRYSNTPISADQENIVAVQYQGELYYLVFKTIQPGTELFVWYGDEYGDFLEIEKFEPPKYYHGNPGYVGGWCEDEEEGLPCLNDKYTVCADNICLCIPGSQIRAGQCALDGTIDGVCNSDNGETCKRDKNAVCLGGVCVCKNNTTPANGACRSDEMYGGQCTGKIGHPCVHDNNTECVHGFCRCIYGASAIGNICVVDETYHGRCTGVHGDTCDLDNNAECWNKICICKKNTSVVNGKCQLDGSLRGQCIAGHCSSENLVCDMESNICICRDENISGSDNCLLEKG